MSQTQYLMLVLAVLALGVMATARYARNQWWAKQQITVRSARLGAEHFEALFLQASPRKAISTHDQVLQLFKTQPKHQRWSWGIACELDASTGPMLVSVATTRGTDIRRGDLLEPATRQQLGILADFFDITVIKDGGEIARLLRRFRKNVLAADPDAVVEIEPEYREWRSES